MKWKFIGSGFPGAPAILSVALACVLSAQGGDNVASTAFIALSSVSVPEIPAKASELVEAAPAANREQTARDVLRAVSVIARPGVLPYVVSAVCRGTPEAAGAVVATATALRPQDVLYFCHAALCAAPGSVESIVFSACKVAPSSCANVALLASRLVPRANGLILASLSSALPALKFYLDEAQTQAGTNDFEAVIRRTVQLLSDASKAPIK